MYIMETYHQYHLQSPAHTPYSRKDELCTGEIPFPVIDKSEEWIRADMRSIEMKDCSSSNQGSHSSENESEFEPNFDERDSSLVKHDPTFSRKRKKAKSEQKVVKKRVEACKSPKMDWTHQEELFLVGSVIERFLRTGSLASRNTVPKGSGAAITGDKNRSNKAWLEIKYIYDFAWEVYLNATYPVTTIRGERTATSLLRHFKVMKKKLVSRGESSKSRYGEPTIRSLYYEFQKKYFWVEQQLSKVQINPGRRNQEAESDSEEQTTDLEWPWDISYIN